MTRPTLQTPHTPHTPHLPQEAPRTAPRLLLADDEAAPREHHDHLIDIDTGRVIEFHNEEIERIQERVARELGFKLVGHRLQLFGVPLKRGGR